MPQYVARIPFDLKVAVDAESEAEGAARIEAWITAMFERLLTINSWRLKATARVECLSTSKVDVRREIRIIENKDTQGRGDNATPSVHKERVSGRIQSGCKVDNAPLRNTPKTRRKSNDKQSSQQTFGE